MKTGDRKLKKVLLYIFGVLDSEDEKSGSL